MSVQVSLIGLGTAQVFKLEYSTSTGGPWTDVGGIGSGEIWRGFNNATPADGATISSALLSASDVVETYEEANNSAGTPNAIGVGQDGEWDWVVQNNGAAASTAYYFRMAKSGGTALDTYTNYPQITTSAASLAQQDYRWYDNNDAIQPTTPQAAENTAASGVANTAVQRLRINVTASNAPLATGETFKLQYSTSTGGPWTDVGGIGSGEIWRGSDNPTPADGATLSSALLSASDVVETYEEANNSAGTPNTIGVGQEGEWDWVVQNNGAVATTTYYFRMVKSGGTALSGYTNYPELSTAGATLTQKDYRWYDNVDAIQPTTPLAAENTTTTSVAETTVVRLRLSAEASAPVAAGETFKLQYSTSTGGPWTDVGGLGSGETWRGFDNAMPADGATITATLLSTSDTLETCEEANNSAATPNQVLQGTNADGEWDWVVQNNGAAGSTTYYFRMVKSSGTALDGYNNYPQLSTAGPALSQEDYRWYQNADAVQPTTPEATENTALSNASDSTVYRLRMNLEGVGSQVVAGQTFKLQYSTSTGGPWTDVGGLGSGEIWRGFNNATPADGATLSSVLLGSSNVVQTYEEANNSAVTPNAVNVGQRGEWDWVVQNNGAVASITYYYRMVESGGAALNRYTTYPTLTTATPVLTQDHYRWYDNTNAVQPTVALGTEDTLITDVGVSATVRLRVSIQGASYSLIAGQTFKLQYGTSTSGPWTDVGGLGSGETWRGFDNATPADGATITANLLSGATILETYEETNNSASTPNAITVGNSAEWDWVIDRNGGSTSTTYYFRMTYSNGTALDTYSEYPALSTSSGGEQLEQLDYRWFDNANSLSPGTALAAQNTGATSLVEGTPYHVRIGVKDTVVDLSPGPVFKLQFSTSTSGPWTDVGGIGSGETWRGFDNSTPADGAAITSNLLTGATILETYEEANNSATMPVKIDASKVAEWAWVVQPNATLANTTYYFRMVRANDTPLDTYTNYPTVTTGNATPDNPTSLGPAQFVDNDTGWTNDNTPTVSFTLTDPDVEQQVRFQVQFATDSGFSGMVADFTSDLQSQGAATYTVGQTGGTYATGSASMTLTDTGTGYFWRALTLDELAGSSSFSAAGAAGTADIRVDTTPPTAGTVLDGTASDIDFNDGSLTTMSANWSGFGDAGSGVDTYEYSVGTSPGFINIKNWTSNGASVSITDASMILHTGQTYYFNVRATDIVGNTMVSSVSSDGQAVLPTFSVSVSATDIQMGNFGPDNNNTQTKTVTVTVSTNAYHGYVIQMYALDFLRSEANPAVIIPDFSAGTYANPAVWGGSDTGWGFNTDDCDLNGGDFWTGGGCTGNPKYAPITQLEPGDMVANHTNLVTGSTGAVVSEQFTVTLRATTASSQLTSDYTTILVFVVVPEF